jgi:hypothetical protein
MIETILGLAKDHLQIIDIPYEFMRFTDTVKDRYWVGEFTETPTDTEDGYGEGTLLLTGTTRKTWSVLMQDRATIEDHFPKEGGLRIPTDNGGVEFYHDNSIPVPTGEAELKRMQINLHIKSWKGLK